MQASERKELYRQLILKAVPRILSELDRDPFSFTFGSFDREYWAWATKDFSNMDLERAIYPLTLIFLNDFSGNRWHRSPRVKDYIMAGIEFMQRQQYADGSFDHHYPFERSFVGIAFPLYEVAQAYILLTDSGSLNEAEKQIFLGVFRRAADFLLAADETHGFISNHRLGAVCALTLMHRITGETKYRTRAEYFLDSVKRMFCASEGWFYEYGGADPGYQTLDTYYAANYYRLTRDEVFLKDFLLPSVKFLTYFMHPDGSIGGEYGSRNSPLFFPSGFELLSRHCGNAEVIASQGAAAIARGDTPGLLDYDLRNFVPMLSSFVQAFFECPAENLGMAPIAPIESFEKNWPQAGLSIHSDNRFYVIHGLSKGGVLKIFDKKSKKLVFSHAGYVAQTRARRAVTTQFLSREQDNPSSGFPLEMEFYFFEFTTKRIMTKLKFFLFRVFNLTIGRNRLVNYWVRKYVITGIFIHRKKKTPFKLRRRIRLSEDAVEICDDFSSCDLAKLAKLRAGDFFTTIYMASTKYYRNSENSVDILSKQNLLARIMAGQKILYTVRGDKVDISFE